MRRLPAIFLLSAATLWAQQPESGVVTFKASSQLVVEIVTVKDKSGKSVEGLTAKDFTVTENGTPQEIRLFEYQRLGGTPETPVAGTAPATELRETPPLGQTAIVPEAAGELHYRNRRLLVLYFDMTSMPTPDQLRALSAAQKFVRTQMTSSDLVAMMSYASGAIKVVEDFTDDRNRLLMSLGKMIIAEEGLRQGAADDAAVDTGSAFGQDDSEFNLFNTDRQLAALQTAAGMLGRLNEKKALIYFASGLQLNGVDNQAQLRATINAAIRANVALFPVDTRGLVAQAPLGDATQGSPGGLAMYTGSAALAMSTAFQQSQDTLYALAADTGGKSLLDANDLSLGILQAQKAYSDYYLIGYYTTNAALDGRFRRIKITAKEVAATLDYRQGYFGSKEFGKFTAADKERQLEDALLLEDPVVELTIAMEVNYFQLNRAEYYVPVALKIPGGELELARKGGFERTVIDFIGEIKDEYGVTVQNLRDKVDIKISGATAAELVKRPIEYDAGYTLLPGTYVIKVLARDNETGRIGTYQAKFVIPNLNKEDKRIPISSVVLSSQREDLKNALYTAQTGKDKEQVANPLVYAGQKLIPSVTRVFSRGKDMYVFLQAYQPGAQAARPVAAYVTFYRDRLKAFETPPLLVSDATTSHLKTVPLRFSVDLGKLPTGRYTCQVTVLDPAAQKVAFWQAPVVFVP